MNLEFSSFNRSIRLVAIVSSVFLLVLLGGCAGDSAPVNIVTDPALGDSAAAASDKLAFSEVDAESEPVVGPVNEAAETVSDADGTQKVSQSDVDDSGSPPEEPVIVNGRPLDQTTNILLLGSDRRPDTPNWRTDVMMVIALDRENGRAGVISIPRDVFIEEIPNHKPNRVNVVDYLGELDEPDGGGPALLGGIIERNMGIPIHHYLRFSFDSFREVVDALDGVPVDIDCEFSGFIEEEGGWLVLEPGMHRLTGNEAMIYVRDRQLTGGDLNRARRQQRFVWAVRNQVLDENLLTRIPALYTAMSGSVDTDIGLVTTLQLARLALALDPEDLYGMVLAPPELLQEGWALGMSVFLPDWALISENVQLVFDNPPFMIGNTPDDCR